MSVVVATSHNVGGGDNPYGDIEKVPGINLTVQGIFDILVGLTCWLSRFALLAMIIMLVIYGLQFIASRGEPGAFAKAKKSLNYALVGILVIMATYTIIATVANLVNPSAEYTYFLPITCSQ